MPRSAKDSDEEVEPKTGRRTRALTSQSVVDSPIRRSSRIKQHAKSQKSSPSSDSDTSIYTNQPVRTTRQRTATMDSTTTETLRRRPVRKLSISSEASEVADEIGTLSKRTIRRSFTTAVLNTPTKARARAASGRLVRADSETKSPLPSSRITRSTRASSVDPEILSDQSKSVPSVSTKTHRRASVLPSQSPVKEEIEEKHESGAKIDMLDKVEEFTSPTKDKIEEDNSGDEMILAVALYEVPQQLANDETYTTATIAEKNKQQRSCAEDLSSDVEIIIDDESVIDDGNVKKNTDEEDKSKITENEESMTKIEDSSTDIAMKLSTKELTVRLENIFETSIGEQKRSPSNKENQTLNIINDTSAEKNIGSIVSNVTSLNNKSPTTVFANKSLNEREDKFMGNEPNSDKRCHSRKSTEITVKQTFILKESTDDIEEITNSSTDPSSPIIIHEKKDLDSSSIDDTAKRHSLGHDVDKKSATANRTVKPVSSLDNDTDLVKEIIDDHIFIEEVRKTGENATQTAKKLDKSVKETCNITTDNKERNSCSLTDSDNNEMILELEESNVSQDKNKSLNESMKMMVESSSDHSNESIDIETCDDKSITVNKAASVTQEEIKFDLLGCIERAKKNLSNYITQSMSTSCSINLETINPPSSDLDADNATIQDVQSGDVTKIPEEFITDVSPKKTKSINTSLKINKTPTSTQRKNESISALSVEEKSTQLNQEDQENMEGLGQENSENVEINKSNVDILSMFRDIPDDEENGVEAKKAVEDESNPISVENESEVEYDLVLVNKEAWLAAENLKTIRDKERLEYDSDDSVLLKSQLCTTQVSSNKKKLSTTNEALLVNIDDDKEQKEEEEEKETTKPIKKRKSSIKGKSALEKTEDSSITCINVDSSDSVDKFLNKSEKDLNHSSSRASSRLSKSGQVTERFAKTLDESVDEIEDDVDKLNRSLQTRKNASLRKSTEKRESLNESSKDTPSTRSQSTPNNSMSKSQINDSEEDLDNTDAHMKKSLKKKKQSLDKSDKRNEDADIDEIESESKNLSSEKSGKGNKDVNVEDYSENDEDKQSKDLKHKKSDLNYSTVAYAGSLSSNSSKSSDDTTQKSLKDCKFPPLFFDSDINNDDCRGSTDSDIKKEYNLDGAEQKYSDDNIPYDECRTSESESSDLDDTGSDLADFIVADNAIEDKKSEEEGIEEQNDEDDEQEEENEAAEEEEIKDEDINDEQVEDEEEENNGIHAEEEENEKSVRAKMNISKNKSNKSPKIGQNKKKMSIESTYQSRKENIKAKKSYVDETEQSSIKQSNESEKNGTKLSNVTRISLERNTSKINSSKEEFVNDVEIAATVLETAKIVDKESNVTSEIMQRKKKKSRKDSTLKKDLSFKEPKRTSNKEKLLHTSLPSDLLEGVGRARPVPKTIELNKTINVTHTETPTKRDLMKEKLNESAPELKLEAEAPNQLQKRRLSKKESNIAKKKTDEMDSDEEVPNLIALFNDNIQEPSQRKQKKRKNQVEEMSNEIITENIPQYATESDIPKQQKKKKKKTEESDKLSQSLTVEDTIPKDPHQLVEKKKKKNIDITKVDKNAKESDIQQEDIGKKKRTLYIVQDEEAQHNKKKKKIIINTECDNTLSTENVVIKKKTKWQEMENSENILSKESLKNKKKKKKEQEEMEEEKILHEIGTSKSKSKSTKKQESEKLQPQNVFLSKTVKSKNAAISKARNEALEAIKSVTERHKLNKKLKKERENNANTIQKQDANILIKRKKTEKQFEEQKQIFPPSTSGLKRLSDNVINELSDAPRRVKRQKLSQNTEQVMPSLSMKNPKVLETKMKNRDFIPLSSSGSTTQFAVVDVSKAKKKSSKTVASYRQRMVDRNNREPVSSYLMYLQKQCTKQNSTKDDFSDIAF